MQSGSEPVPRKRTWSLIAGVVLICRSLWALHRFCDGYSESTLNPQVRGGESLTVQPAEPVCTRWLGVITLAGGGGVVSLLGALALQMLTSSRRLAQLAAGLAVVGRLIALGSLGTVLLVLVLFNRF